MALKYRIKTLSEVDEALHSFYTKDGEEYVLGVEGAVDKAKLGEFRDNNINLKRQIDELTGKYKDIDPEEYAALKEKSQKERDKKLIDAGKVDELVNERVKAMQTDYEKQVNAHVESNGKLTKQLESLVIDNAIREAATKSGVRPTAVDDVLLRGRQLFKLQDGKAIPMEGDKPVFGKSGDPMDIGEWIGGLTEKAPHLFEPNAGGGTPKTGGQGGGGGKKVITRAQFDALGGRERALHFKEGGTVTD